MHNKSQKSLRHDNIINLCLCLKQEQTCQPSMLQTLIPKLKLHLHLTKSPNRNNIYKSCLYMPREGHYLGNINIITCLNAHARKYELTPSLHRITQA